MNLVSDFSIFQFDFTILFPKSLSIHFFSLFSANLLWSYDLLRDFSMHSLSVSPIHLESTIYFVIPLWLAVTLIHEEFTIFFAISLGNHQRSRKFITDTLSILRIPLKSIFSRNNYEFTVYFANSLWIHAFSFTLFRYYEKTMDTLLISQIHFKFTILYPKSLWLHYLRPEINLNSLSASPNNLKSSLFRRNHYDFTTFLENHYKPAICFRIFLWIHYLFRDFTLNSLSFSRIHL